MKKICFSLLFVLIALFPNVHASRVKFIDVDTLEKWEKFLFLAEQSNLGILVEVCDYNTLACDLMRNGTFRDRELARFVNENYIAIAISVDSEFGKQFSNTFPVMAYPTYFFGSFDEVFFEKIEGVVDVPIFLEFAQKGKLQITEYPTLTDAYFNDKLTREQWLKLLDITELNKGLVEAQGLSREFMLTLDDKDLSDTLIWPFINRFCVDESNAVLKTLFSNPELLKNPNQTFDMELYLTNIFNYNLTMAIFEKDSFKMERMIATILPKMKADSADAADLELRTRQAFFAETFDWESYITVTKDYVNTKPSQKAQYFQAFAQQLLESYEESAAINAADKLIDEALLIERNFEILMLKSYLLANNNKMIEAQKNAFEARKVAMNPQQEKIATDFLNTILDWHRR